MSDRYDFTGVRGEGFYSTLTFTYDDNSPFNLSGCYLIGGIRYRYTDSDLVNFTTSILNPPESGVASIALTSGQVSGLPVSECLHYVKVFASGSEIPLDALEGYFRINPL